MYVIKSLASFQLADLAISMNLRCFEFGYFFQKFRKCRLRFSVRIAVRNYLFSDIL